MASGSPHAIREVRVLVGTTFNSNHSNAASATWTSGIKVAPATYEPGDLKQDGFPDDSLKTRLFDQGAPDPGLTRGSYKMSFRGLGSYINTDPTPEQIMMNAVFGDIVSPTTERNVALAVTTSSTTILNIASINSYCIPGQALLVGKKGDGRGNGEVKPIVACNAAAVVLGVACSAAPTTGDQVVISTTCFLNEDSPQSYIDHLAIGHATADQKQSVGGMGKIGFSGLGTSERPTMTMDMTCADWRTVPSTDRASLQHATAPRRGTVAFSKGIGLLHLGDYNTSTRIAYRYGDFSHDPGLTYEAVPGPQGVNGVEGWQKQKTNPSSEFTLLFDQDMPGLEDDFRAKQAKHMIAQFGHTQGACFAVEQSKCYLSALPADKGVGSLSGVTVKVHGCDDYNSASNVRSAAAKYHGF